MPEFTEKAQALLAGVAEWFVAPCSSSEEDDAIHQGGVLSAAYLAERQNAQPAPDPRDARIDTLEDELAKERERPRWTGSVVFVAKSNGGSVGTWLVEQRMLVWEHKRTRATFLEPDAERHAREHAAMLTAREEGADA